MRTVGLPGAHGAEMAGTHGHGVRTPAAADVADATVGLASDVHIPKGMMFVIGLLSIMFASGVDVTVLFVGRTLSAEGAMPKLHISCAPAQTAKPIIHHPFFCFIYCLNYCFCVFFRLRR
jgi:hypothetical protein